MTSSSAGKVRSASSIALTGSESPTRDWSVVRLVRPLQASRPARLRRCVPRRRRLSTSRAREMWEAGADDEQLCILACVRTDGRAEIGRGHGRGGDDEQATEGKA